MADQRDDLTWIAVELNRLGEDKVQDGTLAATIRNDLGVSEDLPVFVPAATYPKGARNITIHLMEGYVFVASGLPDTTYFGLERCPYVSQVISSPGNRMRVLRVITNTHIESLRRQLRELISSDISPKDHVKVVDGVYRGLDGDVVGLDESNAFVEIRMRSLEVVATIPTVFLEVVEAGDYS